MNNSYVIQWKNKLNGRAGKGTRQLTREEAQQLAEELNREYPQILHEPVPWRESLEENSETAVPAQASGETNEPGEEEESSTASHSLPA